MSRSINIANVWPESLPLPFIDFSGGADVATLFSPGDAAVIKRRSRQTQTFATIGLVWKFNAEEFVAFREFWEADLGCGTASFAIELRYPKISELNTWIVKLVSELSIDDTEHVILEVTARVQLLSLATVPDKATAMEVMEITRLLDGTIYRRELDGTGFHRLLE